MEGKTHNNENDYSTGIIACLLPFVVITGIILGSIIALVCSIVKKGK